MSHDSKKKGRKVGCSTKFKMRIKRNVEDGVTCEGCIWMSLYKYPTQIQIQVFGMVVTNLLGQNEKTKCQYRT